MDLARRDIFVGRARELAVLTNALGAASEGRGEIVLLGGEPGIGKSRTADELARRARADRAQVLYGRCFEKEGAPPFWPWVQMLRSFARAHDAETLRAVVAADASVLAQLCPDLGEPGPETLTRPTVVDPATARFRLFEAVTSMLRRAGERTPLVLVIEDLHGADLPSLLLLQFLTRELSHMRALVVGTFRDVALTADHPLAATFGELVRERHTTYVLLRGLGRDEVAEYLRASLTGTPPVELIDAVYDRTEGNPLFVAQVTRMLASGMSGAGDMLALSRIAIPTAVQAAIGNRVAELSPASRTVLDRAAIFGRELRRDALVRIAEGDAATTFAALDDALAMRLLEELPDRPGWLRFTHVLIRDVLYARIASSERHLLHRRAAEALIAVTGPDADPPLAELAGHFAAADDARVIEFAQRAGDRAAALLAYEEAVKQYRLALAAVDRLRPTDEYGRCELLLAVGDAQRRSGDIAAAKETILRAAASARRRADREQLSRAALAFGAEFAWGEGAVVDEVQVGLLEEAATAWSDEDAVLHARILGRLAAALYFVDVPERRAALCERAVAMARRLGDDEALLFALDSLHTSTWGMTNQSQRLSIADEMLRVAGPPHDPRLRFRAHLWRASDMLELQNLEALDVEIAACRGFTETYEEPILLAYVGVLELNRAVLAGRLAEAEERFARFVGLAERAGISGVVPIVQFMLLVLRGEIHTSIPFLEIAVTLHPGAPGIRCMLAWAYAEAGDLIGARREIEVLSASRFRTVPRDGNAILAFVHGAAASALLKHGESSAMLYDALLPCVGLGVTIAPAAAYFGSVSHYLGALASVLERWEDAERHFAAALADQARLGAAPWTAHTEHEYGAMLLARAGAGDRERASALLARALATAEALGMAGLERRARALLQTRGVATATVPVADAQCRLEGDVWAITYDGTTIRLRDSKGLRYLVQLLRDPSREFHATELVAIADVHGNGAAREAGLRIAGGLGDAGPKLDRQAQAAYRARLGELRETLAEAERDHDLGTIERTRAEIDALQVELVGAARGKRSASHGERARIAVTKGLKTALERVATAHPGLGAHLNVAVRRGYYCSYEPDPRRPITWHT